MKRGRKPKCPYCGSGKTVHKGSRVTVTLGKRPLALCRACKRKFTIHSAKPRGRQPVRPPAAKAPLVAAVAAIPAV